MDKLYLTSNDADLEDYEAEISTCVLVNDSINILFQLIDEGDPVQGRLSLKITNKKQSSTGVWIYPDKIKEKARISESQEKSEEGRFESKIDGILDDFNGDEVLFIGHWIDEDGKYDLEIDAKIAK